MTDREFDALLQENLSDLPPAPNLTREINPWRKAFHRILWGLALNNITLNFLKLQYILPTIGILLLLLGFRTLRRENNYFKAGWVLTIITAVCRVLPLGINATIWQSAFAFSIHAKVYSYVFFVVMLALMLCLRAGLRAVQRKAGVEMRTRSATALAVWYFMILPLSLLSELGSLLAIPMVVAYIFIIICLWKLSKVPEESGYAMQAAPVRLSDGWFTGLCCGLLALLMAVGLIFFRQYPMEFTPASETKQEEAIADLSELAIPENILRDLTDEDLAACMGATRMAIHEEEREFENGEVLHITSIALNLSGDGTTWKFIHHFQWAEPPSCYGTEAIQLWTVYRSLEGWYGSNEFTGRVLYDRNSTIYAAPYFSLGTVNSGGDNSGSFWNQTDPVAAFSFPKGGENYRCYVAYDATLSEYGWISNSWANYTHQLTAFQYPVQTAEQYITQRSMFSKETIFEYDQSQIMFHPLEDGTIEAIACKWRSRTYEPSPGNITWYWGDESPQEPEIGPITGTENVLPPDQNR